MSPRLRNDKIDAWIKRLLVNDVPGCDGEPQLTADEASDLADLLDELDEKIDYWAHRALTRTYGTLTTRDDDGSDI